MLKILLVEMLSRYLLDVALMHGRAARMTPRKKEEKIENLARFRSMIKADGPLNSLCFGEILKKTIQPYFTTVNVNTEVAVAPFKFFAVRV